MAFKTKTPNVEKIKADYERKITRLQAEITKIKKLSEEIAAKVDLPVNDKVKIAETLLRQIKTLNGRIGLGCARSLPK